MLSPGAQPVCRSRPIRSEQSLDRRTKSEFPCPHGSRPRPTPRRRAARPAGPDHRHRTLPACRRRTASASDPDTPTPRHVATHLRLAKRPRHPSRWLGACSTSRSPINGAAVSLHGSVECVLRCRPIPRRTPWRGVRQVPSRRRLGPPTTFPKHSGSGVTAAAHSPRDNL